LPICDAYQQHDNDHQADRLEYEVHLLIMRIPGDSWPLMGADPKLQIGCSLSNYGQTDEGGVTT
jgi:hypothetical protein